jgi:hypothetical protein
MAGLKGGTTGQILSKTSGTDMAFTWITNDVGDITEVTAGTGISGGGTSGTVTVTNSMATAIDAKGDLVPGTGADTFARLAVGTDYGFLQADSGQSTGLAWNNAAFISYTATLTAGGGTFTSASAAAKYQRIGKICVVKIAVTITLAGTATGTIAVQLPFTSANDSNTYASGSFRENNVTGLTGVGRVVANSAAVNINKYDDTSFIADARLIVGTIIFEVA